MDGLPYVVAPLPPSTSSVRSTNNLETNNVPPAGLLPYTVSGGQFGEDENDQMEDHYSEVIFKKTPN